ncbi:hypothetical protein EK904_004696 [Melospiza melodia maxima]|nr:hypothetical protein EK904_004696 [Melospiza melodia maxima]
MQRNESVATCIRQGKEGDGGKMSARESCHEEQPVLFLVNRGHFTDLALHVALQQLNGSHRGCRDSYIIALEGSITISAFSFITELNNGNVPHKKKARWRKTMPLFSKSHKNPAEIVKVLKENMAILEKQEKKTDKQQGSHSWLLLTLLVAVLVELWGLVCEMRCMPRAPCAFAWKNSCVTAGNT